MDVDELDKVRALDKGVMDEGVSDTNQIFGLLNQQVNFFPSMCVAPSVVIPLYQ